MPDTVSTGTDNYLKPVEAAFTATQIREKPVDTTDDKYNIIDRLAKSESSGSFGAVTKTGKGDEVVIGRLQFSEARLKDYTAETGNSTEGFLNNKNLQREVEKWHIDDIKDKIKDRGLDKYYGEVINGVAVDEDAIIAMAHLGGMGGASKFLGEGGEGNSDPSDRLGTALSDYGKKFSKAKVKDPEVEAEVDPLAIAGIDPIKPDSEFDRVMYAALDNNTMTDAGGSGLSLAELKELSLDELLTLDSEGSESAAIEIERRNDAENEQAVSDDLEEKKAAAARETSLDQPDPIKTEEEE